MPDAEFKGEPSFSEIVQWSISLVNRRPLARAPERGAKRAWADVGRDGEEAARDIRDLRSLLDCIRLVRRTAMQTAVRMITTGVSEQFETTEKANDIQRRMLKAAARRPRDRGELDDRLRDGGF
ncbi:DUF6127 family protein [Sedimentitalea sp. HM32M-2]|uniref:DUF6127 family protein n=1 Tax=Sedimentitalea sp. HM32M-2 TaxID=3351566 RepID=UPI003630BDD1